ncbi:Macrolide export protein MacA [Planctomycetes bacterium Pan216]|uniref:Macrolide export protein MacA n=1 Tax=Kolteria novifilia TaxID=2527975 RepID=A0A518B388_9BACT|nr:Macrolide export protein MacA [Planctomycetes bacterium Pan216]
MSVAEPASTPRTKRSKSDGPRYASRWIISILALCLIGAVVWTSPTFLRPMLETGDGLAGSIQTAPVRRGTLRINVTEDGNVESASNIELKCMVQGGTTILSIIEDGTRVTEGTELVRFEASNIEQAITEQTIAYERARSSYIQALETYESATIAVKEYFEGTYVQELQVAEGNLILAEENLKSSQNMLDYAEKMFRKGYITQLQLEANRFSVQQAELDLGAQTTARRVLVEYTKPKTVKELESARDSAEAQMLAEKAAADLEKSKLERLKEQLLSTVIVAPRDGMVVYNNEQSRRRRSNNDIDIYEGATVREFQTIIRLPDLDQMQVRVSVHETKVSKVKAGMPAVIQMLDHEYDGHVVSVANQPEPGSWFSSSVKEYATVVSIDDESLSDLKPGMTAEVTITIAEHEGVLMVPLLAVVEIGEDHYFAYVRTDKGFEKRPVVIGASNDTAIEIRDGLVEGERVILNPRAVIPEVRTEMTDAQQRESEKESEDDREADANKGGEAKPPRSPGMPSEGGRPPASKKSGGPPRQPLMTYDADKDGKVTKAEVPDRMKGFFDRLDANKDGGIDAQEADAAAKRFRAQAGAGPTSAPAESG